MRCVFVTEGNFFRIFDAVNDMVIAVQLLSSWHFLLDETGYAERQKRKDRLSHAETCPLSCHFFYICLRYSSKISRLMRTILPILYTAPASLAIRVNGFMPSP